MKLSDHVYFVEGVNSGKYPFCNCLFIDDEKSCLIDTGAGRIADLKPDLIINSHWHEDHVAKNSEFNAKICVHELDAEAVESYDEFKRRYDMPDELVKVFANFEFTEVDATFSDEDEFNLGDVVIRVIHTPGHSAGHCCFLVEDDIKILFLGDIDLSSFGPWYGCLDCDVDDFVRSIKKISKIVEDENIEVAVPGHGDIVVGGDVIVKRLDAYLQKILERERKIIELTSKSFKVEEMVGKGIIYRKLPEPKPVYEHIEKIMIQKHLERLKVKI